MTTQPAMTVEQLRTEIERLERLVYVPGQWHCPRCNFTLQQMNLNARYGTVTANDKPGEKCPNCGSVLWRCTWKSDAIEMGKRGEELLLRAIDAERERDALAARLAGMAAAPSPPDGWELAQRVRTALDKASCPDAFMRIAVEAICPSAPNSKG